MAVPDPSLVVYALSLVPAIMWGVASVLEKRGMAAGGTVLQAAVLIIAIDTGIYWLALFVHQGLDVFGNLSLWALGTFLAAGVVGTAVGRLSVMVGVKQVGASINSAVISTRPLFAALLAAGFLDEEITESVALGIAVLVLGLATLALSQGGDVEGWDRDDLLFPLLAAGCFAVGNVLRRFGLQSTGTTVLEGVSINALAALLVLAGYTWVRERNGEFAVSRTSYLYFAGAGLATAISILALFSALSMPAGRVAIVDALAATSPLFTIGFAVVFLGDLERVTPGVVAGALLVVAGVAFITAGEVIFDAVLAFA